MYKIKILIVDDHALMRDGICALISVHEDIEIVGEASEGKEAVKKAQELAPDVIVMDIAMPGMDGLEATRRIRKKSPKAKVLVLTQYDNSEYVLSSIKAGAAAFLPKRALGAELISAIRAVRKGDSYLYPSAAATLIEDYLHTAGKKPSDRLTGREKEILRLIAEGHTSQEIADMLAIRLKTVQNYRMKTMKKLVLHNRTELIRYAMRKGLVGLDTETE